MEVNVRENVTASQLAKGTEHFFEAGDQQDEDIVVRYKRTSNAGRLFMFLQLGIPTITDACPDSIKFSMYGDDALALVAYHRNAWKILISQLLDNPYLRDRLSNNARNFSDRTLTTRIQASTILDKLSCLARTK
jgi:hypothetical protein